MVETEFNFGSAPQIDESDPNIKNVETPDETPPGRTFTVRATITNGSEVTVPQDGTAQSGILGTNVVWRNPVEIRVDGQTVHEEVIKADATSKPKDATARLTIDDPGEHRIDVLVTKVPDGTVAQEVSRTVSVEEGADDPATPDASDKVTQFLGDLAKSLGTTTTKVGIGMAIAVVLLAVV